MKRKDKELFCNLLANKMVNMYGISLESAKYAVGCSAIQTLLQEIPEYVNHVPLYHWAEETYNESVRKGLL